MKASNIAILGCLLLLLLLLLGGAEVSTAVTCNVQELSPCLDAVTSSAPPSGACCTKVKEQQPCLCQYESKYRQMIDNSKVKKISKGCHVPVPKC